MSKSSVLFFILFCSFAGCESSRYVPPPVTAQMATVGPGQRASLMTLREGRMLFVSRCIECHTLPAVTRHTAAEWPRLIDEMAGRASLNPAERNAVLAYILAARSQGAAVSEPPN